MVFKRIRKYIKYWWSKYVVNECPEHLNDIFDYNRKKEGTLWKKIK